MLAADLSAAYVSLEASVIREALNILMRVLCVALIIAFIVGAAFHSLRCLGSKHYMDPFTGNISVFRDSRLGRTGV